MPAIINAFVDGSATAMICWDRAACADSAAPMRNRGKNSLRMIALREVFRVRIGSR